MRAHPETSRPRRCGTTTRSDWSRRPASAARTSTATTAANSCRCCRRERVSDDELFERALASFRATGDADEPAATGGRSRGAPAIRAFAAHLRTGPVGPDLVGHMTHFLFQLGARRALDYASFFEPRRADLAALKRCQAEQFGRCHVLAVRGQWPALADALERVATTEAQLASALES